ncbi:MAG: Clp protease N-terminal domain-containing protein [Prosthecobacter sp.]
MQVEQQVGSGPETKMVGNIPYTPRVKKVLALAKEAKALNHSYVWLPKHILLGLLPEGDGVTAQVLRNLDAEPRQGSERNLEGTRPELHFCRRGRRGGGTGVTDG